MFRGRGPSNSTSTTLCHVPNSKPFSLKGTQSDGPIIEDKMWSGACSGLCGCLYGSFGIRASNASSISSSVPGSKSAVVKAAVVCFMNKRQLPDFLPFLTISSLIVSVISMISFFREEFTIICIFLLYPILPPPTPANPSIRHLNLCLMIQ